MGSFSFEKLWKVRFLRSLIFKNSVLLEVRVFTFQGAGIPSYAKPELIVDQVPSKMLD